tara:strand:+ start:5704 stop:6813 length:1110 start_codon:yes stop_codon:yes gene_type:complete
MAAGKLEVEIVARLDKLEQGLKQAEQRVKKTGKTMDDALASPGGKLAVNMGKVFAVMGAAEGAIKGVGAAMHVASGLGKLMEGNAEGFRESMAASAELLKTLPFGIGALVTGFEQVLMSLLAIEDLQQKLIIAQQDLVGSRAAHNQEDAIRRENDLLLRQYEIMIEGDNDHRDQLQHALDLERMKHEMITKAKALEAAIQKADEAGLENTAHQLRFQLDHLREQFNLRKMMVNAAAELRRTERLAAETEEKNLARLEEQVEREKEIARVREKALKETIKMENDLLSVEKARADKVSARLGLASLDQQQAKTGFTETASTALGSFTFGESDAQEKIAQLQREQRDLTRSMEQRLGRIEDSTKQIVAKVGF